MYQFPEISLDQVLDSKLSKGDPLWVLVQVTNWPGEPMETAMLPYMTPHPESEPQPKQVLSSDSWAISVDYLQWVEEGVAANSDP